MSTVSRVDATVTGPVPAEIVTSQRRVGSRTLMAGGGGASEDVGSSVGERAERRL